MKLSHTEYNRWLLQRTVNPLGACFGSAYCKWRCKVNTHQRCYFAVTLFKHQMRIFHQIKRLIIHDIHLTSVPLDFPLLSTVSLLSHASASMPTRTHAHTHTLLLNMLSCCSVAILLRCDEHSREKIQHFRHVDLYGCCVFVHVCEGERITLLLLTRHFVVVQGFDKRTTCETWEKELINTGSWGLKWIKMV